jgi:hypothetical protein
MAAKLQRDWAQIASDYMTGDLCISELCSRHNVSRRSLYRRVRQNGWTRQCTESSPSLIPIELRLRSAIAFSLHELQKDLLSERKLTALERERNATAISRLAIVVRSLVESTVAQADNDRRKEQESVTARESTEALRERLAVKLKNFFAEQKGETQMDNTADEHGNAE